MDLKYGTSSFDRELGNFPSLPVVNLFAEEVPTEASVSLISRLGLEDSEVTLPVDSDPIRQVFRADGVLDRRLFTVAGNTVFADEEEVGFIDGGDFVSIAGFSSQLFIAAGQSLWHYLDNVLATVPLPDDFACSKVIVGASRAIVIDKNTEKFYWSDLLDDNVDALSFASAESSPDKLIDILFLGDTLIAFGAETVEFWPATTDSDLPFQRLVGQIFNVGIKNIGASAKVGSTFAWVTNHNQVCITKPENVISTRGIEEKISNSTTCTLWSFFLNGVEFLALSLDNDTLVFNVPSASWSSFKSKGYATWNVGCYSDGVFGSVRTGKLLEWSDSFEDEGQELERLFRALIPIDSGTVVINNVLARVNSGSNPNLEGDYSPATIEMRSSRDGGKTWTTWKDRSFGSEADYRTQPNWSGCGSFRYPGALFEFRVSDPVPFRVSRLLANEPIGG